MKTKMSKKRENKSNTDYKARLEYKLYLVRIYKLRLGIVTDNL